MMSSRRSARQGVATSFTRIGGRWSVRATGCWGEQHGWQWLCVPVVEVQESLRWSVVGNGAAVGWVVARANFSVRIIEMQLLY